MTERKRYFQWPGSWDSETKMIDRVRWGTAKQHEVARQKATGYSEFKTFFVECYADQY